MSYTATVGSSTGQPAVRPRERRPNPHRARSALWVIAGSMLSALLVAVHGLAGPFVSSTTQWYSTQGAIACTDGSWAGVWRSTCSLVGGDAGGEQPTGFPMIALARLVAFFTDMSPVGAMEVTNILVVSLAVFGTFRFMRLVTTSCALALVGAGAFLASPSMLGMGSFGGTFWGLLLLPGFIALGWWLLGVVARGRARRIAGAAAIWTCSSFLLLALDGYAFVMAAVGLGFLVLSWWWPRRRTAIGYVGVGAWALGLGVGAVGYTLLWSSPGDWTTSSIDLFRAMGLDPVTLVLPTASIWWAKALGVAQDVSELWGDGTNSRFNYVGVLWCVLALAGVVVAVRSRSRVALALLCACVAAGVLCLGPSVKLNAVRGPLEVPVTYQSYLMPETEGVVTLPTTLLYENVPGFTSMRATYRWFVLVRLCVIALGIFALDRLAARGRRPAFFALAAAVLATIEIAPAVPSLLATNEARGDQIERFDEDVMQELDEALPDEINVIFAPNAQGGNDYLANYLAPELNVSMYNVGGDKALQVARASWPEPVIELLAGDGTQEYAELSAQILREGLVDAVVVPFFDLRWSLSAWPTSEQFITPGSAAAAAMEDDARLRVELHDNFAIVTLRR